jgi:virulence factor Mce-like protein
MVGAITTLIVIVAVFLAYNASNGLPFVPVYRVSVELENAQRLAVNNEVRIGGYRVGIVESIEAVRNEDRQPNEPAVIAQVDLKLDKTVEPLPADTQVAVRYKSAFGLKYVELRRGTGEGLDEGAVIPVEQSSLQTEFDDIAKTFNEATRENSQQNLLGYGNAFAGRGSSLNETIYNLNPLFENLKPVAELLTDPETRFEDFFPALARTAEIVAPVAEEQAELFGFMATTFGALAADPQALQDTITTGPPTLAEGTVALAVQRPFLRSFAELSSDLRPGVQAIRRALPTLNDALVAGTPVLRRTPRVNAQLARTFLSLQRLVDVPQTKTTLLRLRETFDEATPLANWVVPFQTVCNYWNYFWTWLPEHLTERDSIGYTQRVSIIATPRGPTGPIPGAAETPLSGYSGIAANGRAGGASPNPGEFDPRELPILHGNPYGPAIDRNGNADCQSGQNGYILSGAPGYRLPGQPADDPGFAVSNIPGNRGPTFAGRDRVPPRLQPRGR